MGRCYYFLYSFPGYAEETFDTHFMIGGMRGEKVSEYRFDNKQPLPGNYELDVYVKPPVAWETRYHDPRVTSQTMSA